MLFPPNIRAQIDRLALRFARLSSTTGEGKRATAGQLGAREFAGHKAYEQGDDLRRIDWAAYGRLGKLYLKQFFPEREQVLTIAPDLSGSMNVSTPRKRDSALRLAAALAAVAIKSGAGIELVLPTSRERLSGPQAMNSVYSALEIATATSQPFLEWAGKALTGKSIPGNTVIISDLFEPPTSFTPLRQLASQGRKLSVVAMLGREELSPEMTGAVRLLDTEGQTRIDLELTHSTLAIYRQELRQHLNSWQGVLGAAMVPFVLATSDEDLGDLFLNKITKSGVMA